MAETRTQLKVEDWIRDKWMPEKFGQKFYLRSLRLSSGGLFNFDCVSEDHRIVALISTSGAKTARGKPAAGKLRKIRSDLYFLLLVPNIEQRMVILTEPDMAELCEKEKENGRIPSYIEFFHAKIPKNLIAKLRIAREYASKEVSVK